MLILITYLLTGVLTLLPVLYMMLGAWMGVPVITTEYIAGIGSCALIVSAYLALFDRKTGSEFAILGAILTLPFWLVEPVRAVVQSGLSTYIIGIYVAYLFCVGICIWIAIREFRSHSKEPIVLERARISILALSALCLISLFWMSYRQYKANQRTPCKYVIANGYVGWVVIHFGVAAAPPIPIRDQQLVFEIPESGVLMTRSSEQFGTASDHYFYMTASGTLKEIPNTGWGKGGMVWDESSGTEEKPGQPDDHSEQFFIGTESQYNQMQSLPSNFGDGIQPGDMRDRLR